MKKKIYGKKLEDNNFYLFFLPLKKLNIEFKNDKHD